MPWQKNGTPNTLNLAGATVSVDDLTNAKSNQFLAHTFPSTSTAQDWTFNDSTGSLYALRRSNNGGSDVTSVSQTSVDLRFNSNEDYLQVIDTVWLSGQEKLSVGNNVGNSGAGAANAPSRKEFGFKYVPSPDEILSQAKLDKGAFTNFATDSNLSVLSDVVPIPETIGGWVELGRTTLGSANTTISVTGLANKRYYKILLSSLGRDSGASANSNIQFNADTGSNYAYRQSTNGAADGTATNQSNILLFGTGTTPSYYVGYLANLSGKEKLWMNHLCHQNTAGAGNAPFRQEKVGKWVDTTEPFDQINWNTGGAEQWLTGSEVVVLGWDPDDIHSGNFWEELDSTTFSGSASTFDTGTFTAKKYLWIQGFVKGTSSLRPGSFQFNTDTAANYSIRRSHDGAGDATFGNITSMDTQGGGSVTNYYFDMFVINNSSNEKLVTYNAVSFATAGAGTAPLSDEMVAKWVNTASQITKLTVRSGDSGSLTSAEIKVWGSD